MSIRTFCLVLVCGTRDRSLSAPFSYTLHSAQRLADSDAKGNGSGPISRPIPSLKGLREITKILNQDIRTRHFLNKSQSRYSSDEVARSLVCK
jgi:hypothetical protein